MKYTITPDSPLKHLLNIILEVDAKDKLFIDLKLPIWRPGRYEAANYSKNIQKIKFTDISGTQLSYIKLNASTWRIKANNKNIIAHYTYYAYQMDAGNSWYSEDQLYINFVNCMLYSEDHLNEPHYLQIDLPNNYNIACGLKKDGNHLIANNYYELVDSPMMSSDSLEELTYKVNGVPFSIWLQGSNSLDRDRVVRDFIKFSENQLKMMGEFPFKEYHFLNQLTPYKHYHGVEHGNSTVICIGPSNELSTEALYSEFAGVSSHELFHAWNILKIRPKELLPYDFGKPAVFPTGYVAEGFTTYYGDLILTRSGVFDDKWYFNELNKLFQRHFHNGGRLNNSVVDSSYDLWVDGYQPSAPHKKSSIYVEGAMIALTLDLLIRRASNSIRCLDDMMLVLWNDYGKKNQGYTHQTIKEIAEKLFGNSLDAYFEQYVDGTKDKAELINELLGFVGCELVIKDNPNFLEREFGLKLLNQDGQWIMSSVEEGSLAEKHFSIKDKVLKINGRDVDDELVSSINANKLTFEIERNFSKCSVLVATQNESHYKKYTIEKMKNPSVPQKDSYYKWLNRTF